MYQKQNILREKIYSNNNKRGSFFAAFFAGMKIEIKVITVIPKKSPNTSSGEVEKSDSGKIDIGGISDFMILSAK